MYQTTFSFPQMVNRSTGNITLSILNQSINECLGILLRTRPGEMLGDPNYGCLLVERVFMYNGVVIQSLIIEDILNAINNYEPRITVNSSDITIVQNTRVVSIYIQYTIKETRRNKYLQYGYNNR